MSLVHHAWGNFLVLNYFTGYILIGLPGLLLATDDTDSFDLDKEYYEPESDAGEFVSRAVQDYFVSFLPRCPSAYHITIENANVSGKGSNLRSGNYNLCQIRGKARLRECSSSGKLNCRLAGIGDFWLTIRSSSRQGDVTSQNNELLPRKEPWEDTKADCRPQECSRNQLMAINMKNPMDCSSFYICIMGHHFLLNCPLGHQFSEEYGVCIENKYTS
ncbi:unnamed protein product, partial [Allacma fusca]